METLSLCPQNRLVPVTKAFGLFWKSVRYLWMSFCGFFLFYFYPRKTIVVIASVQRSGSTLLKALLAEAPDISHLPEVSLVNYKLNRYNFYYRAFRLSSKRILVLKRPAYLEAERYPLAVHQGMRFIILYRDIEDWYLSMRQLFQVTGRQDLETLMTDERLLDHWCRIYESMLHNQKLMNLAPLVVTLEELVQRPQNVTVKLFRFAGSIQEKGVEAYQAPRDFKWEWGFDDAGEKIHKLKVIPPESRPAPDSWRRLVAGSQRYQTLRTKLEALRQTHGI